LGGLTFGLLVVEARLAKKLIKGSATNEPPVTDGVQGTGLYGETISFVMLGDSTAAGVGSGRPRGDRGPPGSPPGLP